MKTPEQLFPEQVDGIRFIVSNCEAMLHMGVGAGKTVTTLTALERMHSFPALVIAPKRVAETVWHTEVSQWEHLAHLQTELVLGTPLQRQDALERDADIYVINYENVQWLMNQPNLPNFKAIVYDEISKMKSRGKRYKAIRKWGKQIPVRIGLTGTPRGNSLLGLWAQVDLVSNDRPLLRSYTAFKKHWFYPTDYMGYNWEPKPRAEDEIYSAIRPFTFYLPSGYKGHPVVEQDVRVELSDEQLKQYRQMKNYLSLSIDEDAILAANEAVAINKLRQIAAGSIYDEKKVEGLHRLKMDALADLVESLQGESLLVFYDFRFQRHDLLDHYGVDCELSEMSMQKWNRGALPMLVAHPRSAGHGIQLQKGGHHVCFMSTPWSNELYRQAIGRLARTGQEAETVFVHRIVAKGTIDEAVVNSLAAHQEKEREFVKRGETK